MLWKCPKCGRQFKYETSYHSCVKVSVKKHLAGKSPNVQAAYEKIMKKVKKFGMVNISPVNEHYLFKKRKQLSGYPFIQRLG